MSLVVASRSRSAVTLVGVVQELLPAALVVLLLATVGIVHVGSRVLVVKLGYELSVLDAKATELEHQNAALSVELATLKAPARLEALGKAFGLAPPPTSAVLHVKR
jgi:cell division protein FtsL